MHYTGTTGPQGDDGEARSTERHSDTRTSGYRRSAVYIRQLSPDWRSEVLNHLLYPIIRCG